MDIPAETTETPAGDEFDTAFNDAIAEPTATPPAQAPAAAAPAKEPAEGGNNDQADPATTADQPGDKPAEPATAPAAEPGKPESPPASAPAAEPAKPDVAPAPPAQPAIDPRFLAQAIAEATAAQQASQQKPTEPAAPVAAKPEDFYTPEDTAAVATFAAEWPSEHRAVQSMMKGAIQAEVSNRVNALIGDLNVALTPLFQQGEQVQQTSFQTFVHTKHPDAAQILPDVEAWIGQQPALYQPSLKQVFEKGNAQQVVELLDMYKQAKQPTGAAAQPPASSAAQEPVQPKPRTAPAAAAVAALAAVPAGQRSKPAAGPDANDFDAAFEQALAATPN